MAKSRKGNKDLGPAEELGRALIARRAQVAVAESCTGGLVAKLITDVPGSSDWFERGLVTYSNRAKQDLLGVAPEVLRDHGAVSRETAEAMARGLLVMSPVDWGIAVTGVAGPAGGTAAKPVGLVWFAWAGRGGAMGSASKRFSGSRAEVREAAARFALEGMLGLLARNA